MIRIGLILLALCAWAAQGWAQGNLCRTSPAGTSTGYCASEAFVSAVATGQPGAGLSLVNGLNSNISLPAAAFSFIRIAGPTGAFSVGGIAGGTDGRVLYLFDAVAFAMTLVNESGSSTAANRITTLTGADVTLRAGKSFATLIYDGASSRWILVGTN